MKWEFHITYLIMDGKKHVPLTSARYEMGISHHLLNYGWHQNNNVSISISNATEENDIIQQPR